MSQVLSTPLGPEDLRIIVRRSGNQLSFEAQSHPLGLAGQDLGVIRFEGDPERIAHDQLPTDLRRISDLATNDPEGASELLSGAGTALFRQLPLPLRELLWNHRNGNLTLLLLSDDPYFPWELVKLQGPNGEEGRFLSELYRWTRWLRSVRFPNRGLPLGRLALVQGDQTHLPHVSQEAAEFKRLFGDGNVEAIPSDFMSVTRALQQSNFDAWHLSGHAMPSRADANRASFFLATGPSLSPENLSPARANFTRTAPLFFLNGCQAAQAGFSLTAVGGWLSMCLEIGASSFVGPLWEVRDTSARTFSVAFYKALLAGLPLAEAARGAREVVRKAHPGDPAWLAYSVAGHPNLRRDQAPAAPATEETPYVPLIRRVELPWRKPIPPPAPPLAEVANSRPPQVPSHLKLRSTPREFDREAFLEQSYSTIRQFFEESLAQFSVLYPEVQTRFKTMDAEHFTAAVFVHGKKVASCRIWLSRSFLTGIGYNADDMSDDNRYNEILRVEVANGAFALTTTMGLGSSFGQPKQLLEPQAAAQHLWDALTRDLR